MSDVINIESPDDLDKVMSFGTVIRSYGNGAVEVVEHLDGYLTSVLDEDGQHDDASIDLTWDYAGFEMLTGRTGQYAYNGPVMHTSEYVGGRLAREILETPGTYVTVMLDGIEMDGEAEPEPIGWLILFREPGEHAWTVGRELRVCDKCGDREAYWDDEEYPDNPCFA